MTETTDTGKALRLTIDSLAHGPYGVGRSDGKVCLVPHTAPGDEVEIRVAEQRSRYVIGELSRILEPSALRQDAPCSYSGECGGCPWQHIQYEAQLAAKEKSVVDNLRRIGKLDGFALLPIIRSPKEYYYRRRIRLQIDGRKRLGYYRASSHELIAIDSCLIAEPRVEEKLGAARRWVRELHTRIQFLEMVAGDEENQLVFVAKAEGSFDPKDETHADHLLESHSEISGLILYGRGWRKCWGKAKITLFLEGGLRTEVDADVFTQVNRDGNRHLVQELLRWGEFGGEDRVLELYSGAGNITLPVARRSREVVAVEANSHSVENGKLNSQRNLLGNIRWLRSQVPIALKRLRQKRERFSKIVLNPPRTGAKGLQDDLTVLGAEKIFYVSCDPPTLARDLAALSKKGCRLTRVRAVDLFPHTFHVETLAEMVRD